MRINNGSNNPLMHIKSKIGVEYRRYALELEEIQMNSFEHFKKKIQSMHQLDTLAFSIFYSDHEDYLLPINNDENLAKTIKFASTNHQGHNNSHHSNNSYDLNNNNHVPLLKLFIAKEGTIPFDKSFNKKKKHNFKGLSNLISSPNQEHILSIGIPGDFRHVSSIAEINTMPICCRRVTLSKKGSDKPLGFFIRDGTNRRISTLGGFEEVFGFYVSRLVPGGLAESTGVLAVNDQILEVNGIDVTEGKTLDQVADMMAANTSNLILTIRPAGDDAFNNWKNKSNRKF